MALKTCFILFAIIYSGRCNPLGQTTYCESQTVAPAYLAPGTTTVCESAQNFPYYGTNTLPLRLPYGPLLPNLGSTTVCESQPNMGLPLLDPLMGPYGPYLSRPYPGIGQTTVCESSPNLGLSLLDPLLASYPYLSRPLPGLGATTVCETANLGLGAYGLQRGPLPNLVSGFY